jgi:GxxExxY protein
VSKTLGNAFKEKVYHNALLEELKYLGLRVETQQRINIYYKGKKVGIYVPDIVVENSVIIELKCKPFLTREDTRQFWCYLRGSEYKVGYLVNFGKPGKVEMIRRVYDTARRLSRSFA